MEKSIKDIIPHIKALTEYNFEILGFFGMSEVHVMDTYFLRVFNNYKATQRNSNDYPIELHEYVDGIKFFAIYNVEDFHAFK